MYVSKDLSVCKVLIIHNKTSHNHLMPTLTKVSFGIKDTYQQCVEGHGILGTTVSKIDNAQSTKMQLNGKTPSVHIDPLHNRQVKQDVFHAIKLEKYLDILEVHDAERRDNHHNLRSLLLGDPGVTSFGGDTTFKGVEGKLNKWELTVFTKAYITGASPDSFEVFLDELQRVLSIMKYNNPVYTGIPNDTLPEKVVPRFIKVCWRPGKEPVHDFKSLVSPAQYTRLMDLTYIDSTESLNGFSLFVYGLKITKILDWWRHKEMHEWIVPCIVKPSPSFLRTSGTLLLRRRTPTRRNITGLIP
ncbi:hypothetical protein DFH07DRAFT_766737 [Mycena maculata]|uniref:Uncharacterized protein n=1 Tax=Mycena maculata TaxID=230809 RepID=A0AAD7NUH3_9AGAR|nr:hypothetical protein DFH07DRAFT_766737 [Mycena maculata]